MIRYGKGKYKFQSLARKIAKQKGWSMKRASAYVAGIEQKQGK